MVIEEDLRNLARNPTLSVFEPAALRRLALAATPRTLRAGEVLFRRDDISDGGFFLRSGSIALETSADGEPRMVKPPALIGEMALITRTRRPATAVARENSSVLFIPRTLFQRSLSEQPKSAERLRRIMAARLRGFVKDLDDLRTRALG
ncbi:MAG TPA: cyclic nucleotide-binding domain-containing protein [Methylovirgula sp.]|nr:cyclic nucleotide-binding domain-containing protein [Methylovirgula sp.]